MNNNTDDTSVSLLVGDATNDDGDSDSGHCTTGGTKFWVEGTTPDNALEKIQNVLCRNNNIATADDNDDDEDNDDGGIEITPSLGSGILFNGEITHTGSEVVEGTRFVLMTSITLDTKEDYDDYDGEDDENENDDKDSEEI
mmetsp:Transcript_55784/g.63112  ORF Transcript_55784/g.63112 Transcript_55784/m.63112 type:complete len:141 (-) Transcript_55784:17-439(-)